MAKNIFLVSTKPNTGKSIICLGLINALRGIVTSVGYFKPIGQMYEPGEKHDNATLMIKKVFQLSDNPDDINPASIFDFHKYHSEDNHEGFFRKIRKAYERVSAGKDIVIIDGTDYISMISTYEFDINVDIARNLNSEIILIEDGFNKTIDEIVNDLTTAREIFAEESCRLMGVIINKLNAPNFPETCEKLKSAISRREINYLGSIPYDNLLPRPRISDIVKSLKAEVLLGQNYLSNIATESIVASMDVNNFLKYIKDGTLVITGGDRNDIIMGSIASLISPSYPKISGILLTGGLLPGDSIIRLLDDNLEFSMPILIPVLSVNENTIETVNRINSMKAHISSEDTQKIDIVKSLVYKNIDYSQINEKLEVEKSRMRTPEIFKYEIMEKARSDPKRIVLPEAEEERTLKAVSQVLDLEIAKIILLGNPDIIISRAKKLGVPLDDRVSIIEPSSSTHYDEYVNTYFELRKHKHIAKDLARDLMLDPIYFGTMMVQKGDADGLVSGAVHTTQHTVRPAFEIIKTRPGISSVSSIFFMCLKDRVLIYGDCAIVPNPNADELADIAITSAETARAFNIEPYIAMLSYSTGESGKGPDVDKVKIATETARNKVPGLLIEGPIQYDAAIDPSVAKIKLPESRVAGNATVFIFPDLNTGNNIYKAVQRSAGAVAIGPILQGLNRPVNDLSRGCLVEDIVYTIAITAIQAQGI